MNSSRRSLGKHLAAVFGWSLVSIPVIAVWVFVFIIPSIRYKGAPATFWEEAVALPIAAPIYLSEVLLEWMRARGVHLPDWLSIISAPLAWGLCIHAGECLKRVVFNKTKCKEIANS